MRRSLNPFTPLRRRAKRVYHWFRTQRDIARHPRRHREATERLQRLGIVRSILVVCYGNICRSPYMAVMLKSLLPKVDVSSAGFVGAGRRVPEHSLTLATRRGLDLAPHLSRVVTHPILSAADLIVVMDERQARSLTKGFGVPAERIVLAGDLDPRGDTGRTIRDPWRQPIDVFETSFARLDRCARYLASQIKYVP